MREATAKDIRKEFTQAGFEIVERETAPDSIDVKKGDCIQVLERTPRGRWLPAGPPHRLVRGVRCELEDRGYQKFWYAEGKRFPIRLQDLKALHEFEEEVRSILGLTRLYHLSLGTTCARSVYDRLTGRPDQ